MSFSYEALRRIIKEEVMPNHDAVIEGGIGNSLTRLRRYQYFREMGYKGLYIGINLEEADISSHDKLIYKTGDCFDAQFLVDVLKGNDVKNPMFLSQAALVECLLSGNVLDGYYSTHIEEAVDTLTKLFKKQLHIRPSVTFPVTRSMVNYQETSSSKEYDRFMRFLDESKKRGWEVEVPSRNILIMKK